MLISYKININIHNIEDAESKDHHTNSIYNTFSLNIPVKLRTKHGYCFLHSPIELLAEVCGK